MFLFGKQSFPHHPRDGSSAGSWSADAPCGYRDSNVKNFLPVYVCSRNYRFAILLLPVLKADGFNCLLIDDRGQQAHHQALPLHYSVGDFHGNTKLPLLAKDLV